MRSPLRVVRNYSSSIKLSEGTLIMSSRPHPRHQRISRRLTRLLEDHLPAGLEVPEIEVTTSRVVPAECA